VVKACEPNVVDAGLPGRGPIVLGRERRLMPMMVVRLEGDMKASPEGALRRLTMKLLRQGFDQADPKRLPAAGFLAGRCTPPKPSEGEELDGLLSEAVASIDVHHLASKAPSYIESAMSIGLRGDEAAAMDALHAVVADGGVGSTHDWQAAYYLAQYGDSSGWPAMLACLARSDDHSRLMATRHLFAFDVFNGDKVGDDVIDIEAQLVARLDDVPYVAVEVPGLLAEWRGTEVIDLLASVVDSDRGPEVRAAAGDVLDLLTDDLN
jgi:hypothetical protein